MSRLFIIVWLVLISDGTGALLGARAAWHMRDHNNKRSEYTIALALALLGYAVARFWSTYNSITNAPHAKYSNEFLLHSIGANLLQCVVIWILALTLMNGHRGVLRRGLSRVLKRLE